jgi:hypothetical protein
VIFGNENGFVTLVMRDSARVTHTLSHHHHATHHHITRRLFGLNTECALCCRCCALLHP